MRNLRFLLFFVALAAGLGAASSDASDAQKELQTLITRQQVLFTRAAAADLSSFAEKDEFKTKVQDLVWDFDNYLKKYPDVAAGYAAYGTLLWRIDMRRQSVAMYLKANKIDPNLAYVKNQLGNSQAEDGKPIEAMNYFLAAIKLEPNEPLYHYQLGTLLTEARDEFLKSGEWTRSALDKAMIAAFRRAAELSPERIEFTYRYGEAFYDLEKPDWDEALKYWEGLENRLKPGVEQETVRLHRANILIKQNKMDNARLLLATVTAEPLQGQKEKLIAQLGGNAKK
jgi:tetratricopeptide (TPR) repeat protein